MPPKRMTANPIAPQRYRAGKALPANDSPSASESESDSDSDAAAPPPPKVTQSRAAPPTASSFPKLGTDLAARQAAAAAARAKEAAAQSHLNPDEEGFVTASDSSASEDGESGSDDSDDDEEDYESSSDDSRPRFVAPTFVSKAKRVAAGAESHTSKAQAERDRLAAEEDERLRKAKADEMLQAQLEREAREKADGRRDWDDEIGAQLDDIDDRDGIDPDAEHAAWRLRELKRVKRERESIEVAEREREEVERRRNLSKEEREAEDREHIEAQKEEREGRGKMGFMQKYFHKGAFFQDDGADEAVKEVMNRDVMGARFVDDARNREVLPEYMQIRDMTRLGKKGRTRYKDLKSEDTGRFGDDLYDRRGKGDAGGRYGDGATGANGIAVGERKRRDDDRGDARDEKRPRYER